MLKKLALFFAISLIAILVILNKCTEDQKLKISYLENNIEQLKSETVPIRFKIVERTRDSIFVKVKFYDTEGKELSSNDLTFAGEELSFDFIIIPINDRFLAFPYKVFTNKTAPEKGELLLNFYDKHNFPQIFYYKDLDKIIRKSLIDIFVQIKMQNFDLISGQFGNLVHDIKQFNAFETNKVYKIVSRTKGGIEVMEE